MGQTRSEKLVWNIFTISHWVSIIQGLVPFKLDSKTLKLTKSTKLQIYYIIMNLLNVTIMPTYGLSFFKDVEDYPRDQLVTIIGVITNVCLLLSILCVAFSQLSLQDEHLQFTNEIIKKNKDFGEYTPTNVLVETNYYFVFKIFSKTTVLLIRVFAYAVMGFSLIPSYNFLNFSKVIVLMNLTGLLILLSNRYCIFSLLLRKFFSCLNNELLRIVENMNYQQLQQKRALTEINEAKFEITEIYSNSSTKLDEIILRYRDLYTLLRKFYELYNFQVILMMLNTYIRTFTGLYFGYKHLFFTREPILFTVCTIILTLCVIVDLHIVFITIENLNEVSSKQPKRIIEKVLFHQNLDERIQSSIDRFIVFQVDEIKNAPYGIMTVNRENLLSIFEGTIMMFIIIMQFELAAN